MKQRHKRIGVTHCGWLCLLLFASGCGGGDSSSLFNSTIGVVTGTRTPGTYQGRLYSPSDLGQIMGTASTTVSNDRRTITVTTNNTSTGRNQVWILTVDGSSNQITDGSVSGLDSTAYVLNATLNFLNKGVTGSLNYVKVDGSGSLTVSFDGVQ